MFVRPFGFDHTSIRVPFRALHGALDRSVPVALVKAYIAEIPGAALRIWPNDGHVSAPCNHIAEIADALKDSSSDWGDFHPSQNLS
ncbi:hypothetical protein ACPOL_3099 [Acidisarcina polymorpha]|uniref:Peptidase S33 tripeptidyl aminopeptidase-like C-terminal domain-containing protein n=2 Tax=Acidisarcina polymorpha TaxID=2211140 RepID=A0A2Z5G0U2_9BACT|nr:hypothetical protein ACPOL_3099 [Acidisarcina polymorpha]